MRAGITVRRAIYRLLLASLLAASAWAIPPAADKFPATSTLRWEEGRPGCTFSRGDDGKYRYGFWTADFGIVVAVDSQELEKVQRRTQPIFTLQLTAHYRGGGSLELAPDKITLEFVKHYHDVHSSLDPDKFADKQRNDTDAFVAETEREVRKHPEKKAEKEAALAARQRDAAEMVEFLNTRTLRAVKLD